VLPSAAEPSPIPTCTPTHRERRAGNQLSIASQFLRILEAAKIPAWPKLFHNLRASRETELADEFPIHVVCGWIGNSPDVARKHSFTVTDDHFARAAGEKAAQNPAQSVHAASRTDLHDESETTAPLAFAGGAAVLFRTQVPPRGVEGQQFGTKKNTEEQYGDSRSDSTGLIEPSAILSKPLISEREPPDWVRKQIAALPPEVIAALWVMFRGQTHGSPSDRSR
jgi:hypothetical protein